MSRMMRTALVLIGMATCLVACASGTASSAPPVSQIPTATQAADGSVQPPSSAGATVANICELLPSDQVAQITGLPIDASLSVNNFLTVNDARCEYGEDNEVVIDVIGPGGAAFYDNLQSEYGSNVIPITGIGDKAFQDFTDGSGLVALFGDTAFDVYMDNPNDTMTDDQVNHASEALIAACRAKL